MAGQKAPKFTFAQLAVFDWLMENPGLRFIETHTSSLGDGWAAFYEASENENDEGKRAVTRIFPSTKMAHEESQKADAAFLKRIGGRASISYRPFHDLKLIRHFSQHHARWEKLTSQFDYKFHWSANLMFLTKDARTFWEEKGRDLFEQAKAKREEQEQSVRRKVIVGSRSAVRPSPSRDVGSRIPEGLVIRHPSILMTVPQALCTVVRETAQRVYIDGVTELCRSPVFGDSVISGRPPNQYVAREHILVDDASAETAARMVKAYTEAAEEIEHITDQALEEIMPALERLAARHKQKQAELDDIMSEFLTTKPEDDGPKP